MSKSESIISDLSELVIVLVGLVVLAILFLIAAILLVLITFWYITIPAGIIAIWYYLKARSVPAPPVKRVPRKYSTARIDWIK